MFVCSEKMERKQQNGSVNYFSNMNSFNASPPAQENRGFSIPAEAITSFLFGRNKSVFLDAKNLVKSRGGVLNPGTHPWEKPSHGLSYASTEHSDFNQSKALRSLPPEVSLCASSIPGAKFGVCTRKRIPIGTWIGPFEGRQVRPDDVKPDTDTSQMWEVYEDDKLSYFIDGREEGYSSWMRFIQCARSKDEQNLFAFQYKDRVYYRSFKEIDVGDELLVWYDDGYLQHFGIPTGLQDTFFVTSDAGAAQPLPAQKSVEKRPSPPLQQQHQKQQNDHHQQQKQQEGQPQQQQQTHKQWQQHHQKQQNHRHEQQQQAQQRQQQQGQQHQKQQNQHQQQPPLQLPLQTTTASFSRRLLTDCNLTDQRSSPISDVDSDVSDSGNNQDSIAKGPVGELTSWQCQQCHKTFTQRVALQMHVCPCQPTTPFQCGQCSEAFSNPSQLRAHVISHSSEKLFKCGFCSRAFVGATTLNNHIRSHMGRKPFGCEKCGRTFSQPGLLARHARNPRECKGSPPLSPIKA